MQILDIHIDQLNEIFCVFLVPKLLWYSEIWIVHNAFSVSCKISQNRVAIVVSDCPDSDDLTARKRFIDAVNHAVGSTGQPLKWAGTVATRTSRDCAFSEFEFRVLTRHVRVRIFKATSVVDVTKTNIVLLFRYINFFAAVMTIFQ